MNSKRESLAWDDTIMKRNPGSKEQNKAVN